LTLRARKGYDPSYTRASNELAIVAIIPARYASTRLPGKPLSDILGRPMIQHVYERARRARVERVIVATDDERIVRAVVAFGGEVRLTSPEHRSGTDRIAEVAADLAADLVVNVQGDEPLLDPALIDAATAPLLDDPTLEMATLATPLSDVPEFLNPNVVKVVRDARGDALYFSRAPIPCGREGGAAAVARGLAWRHVGLYVYRRETLLRLARLPPAPLEELESLEQLRALAQGIRIRVVCVAAAPAPAVDTPEDLARVRELAAQTLPSSAS
jgi:3-deoxy-manno-octulosonate cytidylyltransferase (CMP-KDO synthetase)